MVMQIDINSRLIALIGTPLSQSFAARMQNSAYQAAGFNMVYCYCEADSTHLKEIIDGIRYMPTFLGCAVTKPNKEARRFRSPLQENRKLEHSRQNRLRKANRLQH